MMFLAVVRYSHGNRMIHEFRCPLERKAFVAELKKKDPAAKVRLKQKPEHEDFAPPGEEQWYGASAPYNPPF